MLDAERAKANEEAERLQKVRDQLAFASDGSGELACVGLEIRDRAITTYKDELTSVKQQLAMMEKQKADLDDKVCSDSLRAHESWFRSVFLKRWTGRRVRDAHGTGDGLNDVCRLVSR
eukprot:2648023-Rhodomonas_salina.5